MEPAQLSAEDFFKRWRQIGGPPREAQKVVGLNGGRATGVDAAFTREIAERCGFGVLEGVDPNKKNVVGAAVLHTSSGGKFGCLVRVEPNYDTMVCGVLFLVCFWDALLSELSLWVLVFGQLEWAVSFADLDPDVPDHDPSDG